MKPFSTQNDFLTQQQLKDYLGGKTDAEGKARIQKLLDDCELSKEAVAGFSAMPAALADLDSLNQSIAAKAGMAKAPLWMNVLTVVIGAALLAGMTYALWPRKNSAPLAQAPQKEQSFENAPSANSTSTVTPVVLTPKEEHFVNPEMKPAPKAVLSAGTPNDSAVTGTQPIEKNAQPIAPKDSVFLTVKPVIPKNPEAGYNASVGFIDDLKITEFEKYYRKTIEVKDDEFTGVSAEFENEIKRQISGGDVETTHEVPAEKFLYEGLNEFHDGHYGRCIEKMEVLKDNNTNDLNAAFYMGISYVKLEMFGKAIPYLDQVLNATNNVFHEEARWYKALALIGNGDKEAAKKLLGEIAGKDGFYREKAAAKLREL